MANKTIQSETNKLLAQLENDSKEFKPPMGFGSIKPLISKTVWLFKAFNQRLTELEKERNHG